jgi:hypothetical protein
MIVRRGLCIVSSKYEEYRRNAMACERMSHTTPGEELKGSWLRLAESWLRMIPHDSSFADETAHQSVDLAAHPTGSGQADSKRSH